MENTVLGMIEKALNGNGGTNGAYRNNEEDLRWSSFLVFFIKKLTIYYI